MIFWPMSDWNPHEVLKFAPIIIIIIIVIIIIILIVKERYIYAFLFHELPELYVSL